MTSDPVFYRLFETSLETFFLMQGLPVELAAEMAARYEYDAREFKETSHRVDGIFLPKEAGLPIYFLEVQFYPLPRVFADLLAKVYTYLKQHDPGQAFFGVVLFASRNLEPKELAPYKPLLDAGLIRCFYLDEMPELANAPIGLSILYLIRQTERQSPAAARNLVARARTEIGDLALRADLIELIETIILYKLPQLSRKEIQTMLQIHNIRESRAYQEAKEEAKVEAKEEAKVEARAEIFEKGIAIARLAAEKKSIREISEILEVDVEFVHRILELVDNAKPTKKPRKKDSKKDSK